MREPTQSTKPPREGTSPKVRFTLGSFNLRGQCTNEFDTANVIRDLSKRGKEVACLQETRRKESEERGEAGEALVFLDPPDQSEQHYGLGFYLSKSAFARMHEIKNVSNRIAVLRLKAKPSKGLRKRIVTIAIINIYAPVANGKAQQGKALEQFYAQLHDTVTDMRRQNACVMIAGDWNAHIGRCSDLEGPHEGVMGPYGYGKRNKHGDRMVEFLAEHEMYVTNTHLNQPMRRRATRSSDSTPPTHTQVDFVVIDQAYKSCIMKARAYRDHEHVSDHSLVEVTIQIDKLWLIRAERYKGDPRMEDTTLGPAAPFTPRKPAEPTLDVAPLILDKELREKYQQAVKSHLDTEGMTGKPLDMPTIHAAIVKASHHLPVVTKCTKLYRVANDAILGDLSKQQTNLRNRGLHPQATDTAETLKDLKKQRNKIFRAIKKRIKLLETEAMQRDAEDINNAPDSKGRYKVLSTMFAPAQRAFYLLTADGKSKTFNAAVCAEMIAEVYEKLFNPVAHTALDTWGAHSGELAVPISAAEVDKAVSKLNNGKCRSPDLTRGEQYKYGGLPLSAAISDALNNMFRTSTAIPEIGESDMCPANKSGKPHTPTNIRALTIVHNIRKVLSGIALRRLTPSANKFLPGSQYAYRAGKSAAGVIYSFAWLRALSLKYARTVHILGIDMSKAFDTIIREKLMEILAGMDGVDESTLRIIRVLLAGTSLRVKIGSHRGRRFVTIMGSPQGDALSPVLFIIYLEAANREVRACDLALYGKYNGSHNFLNTTVELVYADDEDMASTNQLLLEQTAKISQKVFEKYNLIINQAKTERRQITATSRSDIKYKKLGAELDPPTDVTHRLTRADQAFGILVEPVLRRHTKRSILTEFYNSKVLCHLTANIGAIPLTDALTIRLEVHHRKHIRRLLGVWNEKDHVSNSDLYRMAGVKPIRQSIIEARWKQLRATLLATDSPEHWLLVQYFALEHSSEYAPQLSTHVPMANTMPRVLHQDICRTGRTLLTLDDLCTLQALAGDATGWAALQKDIADHEMARVGLQYQQHKAAKKRKQRVLELGDTPEARKLDHARKVIMAREAARRRLTHVQMHQAELHVRRGTKRFWLDIAANRRRETGLSVTDTADSQQETELSEIDFAANQREPCLSETVDTGAKQREIGPSTPTTGVQKQKTGTRTPEAEANQRAKRKRKRECKAAHKRELSLTEAKAISAGTPGASHGSAPPAGDSAMDKRELGPSEPDHAKTGPSMLVPDPLMAHKKRSRMEAAASTPAGTAGIPGGSALTVDPVLDKRQFGPGAMGSAPSTQKTGPSAQALEYLWGSWQLPAGSSTLVAAESTRKTGQHKLPSTPNALYMPVTDPLIPSRPSAPAPAVNQRVSDLSDCTHALNRREKRRKRKRRSQQEPAGAVTAGTPGTSGGSALRGDTALDKRQTGLDAPDPDANTPAMELSAQEPTSPTARKRRRSLEAAGDNPDGTPGVSGGSEPRAKSSLSRRRQRTAALIHARKTKMRESDQSSESNTCTKAQAATTPGESAPPEQLREARGTKRRHDAEDDANNIQTVNNEHNDTECEPLPKRPTVHKATSQRSIGTAWATAIWVAAAVRGMAGLTVLGRAITLCQDTAQIAGNMADGALKGIGQLFHRYWYPEANTRRAPDTIEHDPAADTWATGPSALDQETPRARKRSLEEAGGAGEQGTPPTPSTSYLMLLGQRTASTRERRGMGQKLDTAHASNKLYGETRQAKRTTV